MAETLFPSDVSYNSRGGPGFRTDIIELDSGAEQRVARWSMPRHSYNVAYGVRSFAELAAVKRFYIAQRGAATTFRFLDPLDFSSALDGVSTPDKEDQLIGTGDGSTTTFQIIKRYSDGVTVRNRSIQKPVHAAWGDSVVVGLDGVQQGGGWTVDTVTGLLTFDSPPGVGVLVTAGYQFHVPARFGADADRLLEADVESLSSGSLSSIPVIEVVDDDFQVDEYPYGGADEQSFDADIYLREARGFHQQLDPSGSSLAARLPLTTNLPTGGLYFWLENVSAFDLALETYAGAAVATITAGSQAIVALGIVSGVKTWFAAVA